MLDIIILMVLRQKSLMKYLSISDIGKGNRYTYLKIGEYSYSAVKFALQDSANRVFSSVPDI